MQIINPPVPVIGETPAEPLNPSRSSGDSGAELDDRRFAHPRIPDLPEDPGSWYKYRFRPAIAAAGLIGKGIMFHSTRHAFALRFLEGGGHVRQLQKAGGWSSLAQMEIYTQMKDEGLRPR